MEDKIDAFFSDLIPGTTRGRSEKALRRVQRGAVQPPTLDEDSDEYDPSEEWVRLARSMLVCGKEVEVFPIRALALAWDNRSSKTVHRAETSRMLPPPNIHGASSAPPPPGMERAVGERLYFDHQIEAVVRVTKQHSCYERHARTTAPQRLEIRRCLLQVWTPAWLTAELSKRSTP